MTGWWNYPVKFEKDGSLAAAEIVTDETVVTGTIEMENETATETIAAIGTIETLGTAVTATIGIVGMPAEENPTGTQGTLLCRWEPRIRPQLQPQPHLHRLREVFTGDHHRLRLHQHHRNFMRRRWGGRRWREGWSRIPTRRGRSCSIGEIRQGHKHFSEYPIL